MKLSVKDKRILLMFLGVLLLAVSYFFVYRPQMEEAGLIEQANEPLQTRLEELLALAKNKDFYIQETESMEAKIQEYCLKFPAAVRQEDGIVLARNMENSMDMAISNVGTGEAELLYFLDGSDTGDLDMLPDETMMDQLNEPTQEQIKEIEQEQGISGEEAAQAAEQENMADMLSGNMEHALSVPALWRVQDTLQFHCTYESLKEAVKYLAAQTGRMTLDNVNAAFDPMTGNLVGSMDVNLFFMTGTDSVYTKPDAGSVAYGTDNIFGTVEAPAAGGETAPEGETAAPEGEAAPAAEGEAAPEGAEPAGQTE